MIGDDMYTFTVTDNQIRDWKYYPYGQRKPDCLCPLSAAFQASLPPYYHAQVSLAQPSGGTIYGYASPSCDAEPVAMYQPIELDEQAVCEFIRTVDTRADWPERRTFTYKRVW